MFTMFGWGRVTLNLIDISMTDVEKLIRDKNLVVRKLLEYIETNFSNMSPKDYNALRNMIRYEAAWLLNRCLDKMGVGPVTLRREVQNNSEIQERS